MAKNMRLSDAQLKKKILAAQLYSLEQDGRMKKEIADLYAKKNQQFDVENCDNCFSHYCPSHKKVIAASAAQNFPPPTSTVTRPPDDRSRHDLSPRPRSRTSTPPRNPTPPRNNSIMSQNNSPARSLGGHNLTPTELPPAVNLEPHFSDVSPIRATRSLDATLSETQGELITLIIYIVSPFMFKLLTLLPAEKPNKPKKGSGVKVINNLGLAYSSSDDSDGLENLF